MVDRSGHHFEPLRSVRLTKVCGRAKKRSKGILQKNFAEIWSRETIESLVEYPEKTDRLEAAAAAGKTRAAGFVFGTVEAQASSEFTNPASRRPRQPFGLD